MSGGDSESTRKRLFERYHQIDDKVVYWWSGGIMERSKLAAKGY